MYNIKIRVAKWQSVLSWDSQLRGPEFCNRSMVWLGSSVVECSHGKPRSFSAPVTFGGQCGGLCSGLEQQPERDCLIRSEQIRGRI